MEEIKDIAMWEETDSELAKYHIQQALNRIQDLKEQIKELFDEYLKSQIRIDKAIEYINRNTCTNVEEQCNSIYLYDEYLNHLLDILKGEDNE